MTQSSERATAVLRVQSRLCSTQIVFFPTFVISKPSVATLLEYLISLLTRTAIQKHVMGKVPTPLLLRSTGRPTHPRPSPRPSKTAFPSPQKRYELGKDVAEHADRSRVRQGISCRPDTVKVVVSSTSGSCLYPVVYENPASTGLTTIPHALARPQTFTEKFTHPSKLDRGARVSRFDSSPVTPKITISSKYKASYSARAYPSVPPHLHLWYSTPTTSTVPHRTPDTFATDCVKDRSTFRTIQRPEAESIDSNSVASHTANYYHSDLVDSYVSIQHSPYPSMTGCLST